MGHILPRAEPTVTSTAVAPPSRAALYVRATRPLYLPTSALPALVGGLAAVGTGVASWWALPVAVLAVVLVHCGVNVVNDVEDFARGVDTVAKMDNSRVFTLGLLSVREGRLLAAGYFASGTALGLVIAVAQDSAALVAVGAAGVLGGWLYTGGPRPYKYVGLGDPMIVLLMGPMITQGAYTAVTGDGWDPAVAALGLCPGFLIAAVLQGNNLSDIVEDAHAGVRTLAVRVGFGGGRVLYLVSLAAAFGVLPVLVVAGAVGPLVLVPWLLAPAAAARARQALRAQGPGDDGLRSLAPLTAQLHLGVTTLLAAGVVVDRLLG